MTGGDKPAGSRIYDPPGFARHLDPAEWAKMFFGHSGDEACESAETALRELQERVSTFDGHIAELEAACVSIQRERDSISGLVLEDRLFARQILDLIDETRHALATGAAQLAASLAVEIGWLAARADVDKDWPEVTSWNRRCEQQRQNSIAGVRTKADLRARDNADLSRVVLRLRDKNPSRSTRSIARQLVYQFGRPIDHAKLGDEARAIDALRKRIERLKPREEK